MRRIRNLSLFAIAVLVLLGGATWIFRDRLGTLFGVDVDAGAGGEATLELPAGYEAAVFASGLDGPRFLEIGPDGILFVAERGADRVVALPDDDNDGVADEVVEVGAGYGRAQDLEFTAAGTLLVAGQSTLWEVTLHGMVETERRAVVDRLPVGGSHATKSVEVRPNGEILLSIGSSCNACDEEDARRASVQVVTDGRLRPSMIGLRNAVGLWVDPDSGRAYATNMGRDFLGDDQPPETIYEIVDGADAGWPRCHAGTLRDPEFGTSATACDGVALPVAIFDAHTAPLALTEWRDRLVVALHGSWNASSKVGYALWWMPWDGGPTGRAEPFATGFLPDGAQDALGRPAGLAVGADGALYVSDDKAGFVYRIIGP